VPAHFMARIFMISAMLMSATGNVVQFVLSEITHCVLALELKLERVRANGLIDLKSGTLCNKKFKPI
jgi:hypothetical protein